MSKKNRVNCTKKKSTHTAGTKSFARNREEFFFGGNREELVNSFITQTVLLLHLYANDYEVLYIYFSFSQREKDPEKKNPHRAVLYLHTHQTKSEKDTNAHVVCCL